MSKNTEKGLPDAAGVTSAKPRHSSRCLGFAPRFAGLQIEDLRFQMAATFSQDQRFGEINGLGHAMVLRPLDRLSVEEVKPDRVFAFLHFRQQAVAELDPLGLAHLALEHRLLYPRAVVFAGARNPPESAPASSFDRGDIVGHQDKHLRFGI